MNNNEKERIVKKYFNRIPAHITSLIFLCFSFKILMTTSYISKNWLNKLKILNEISLFNLMFYRYNKTKECDIYYFNNSYIVCAFLSILWCNRC